MSSENHTFTVPLDHLDVPFGHLRSLPWIVFVVLLCSVFVQIIVNGLVEPRPWLDALAISTVVGLPVMLVAGVATTRWFAARDADAFSREVHRLGGVTVTRAEATLLMSHALKISTHWMGRDVRELPPEYEVALSTEPATTLHLSYARQAGYQIAVVRPEASNESPGEGCEVCRSGWNTREAIADQLGVSPRLQTYLYRCAVCGTYWESAFGSYPRPISTRQAQELRSAPDFERW